MKVPTQAPLGIEVLAEDDGIRLYLQDETPWWRRPFTRVFTRRLDKFSAMWLYQALAKLARRGLTERGYDDLLDDLQRTVAAVPPADSMTTPEWLVKVAEMLRAKGWVKQ